MSVMILLSILAFSGSISANTDTRKPAERETTSKRNPAHKRSISFQHARQQLFAADFFHKNEVVSLTHALLQVARLSQLCLQLHEKEEPDPVKISLTLHAHPPRSADLLNLS